MFSWSYQLFVRLWLGFGGTETGCCRGLSMPVDWMVLVWWRGRIKDQYCLLVDDGISCEAAMSFQSGD